MGDNEIRVIREEQNVKGLPLPNQTRLVLSTKLPDLHLITSSFVLAFQNKNLVLTHLNDRGWDIPGGHIEPGESPEDAMKRELYEETGAVITSPQFLGYERIRLYGTQPDNYKYPYPDSYMVFYCAKVVKLDVFESNNESKERGLFTPEQAHTIPWIQGNIGLYEEAIRRVSSL